MRVGGTSHLLGPRGRLADQVAEQSLRRSRGAEASDAKASQGAEPMSERRVRIDRVDVDDIGFRGAVARIAELATAGAGGYIATVNVDYLVRAHGDPAFRDLLSGARLRVPDGMGIVYGARLAGIRLHGSVTGRLLPEAIARLPNSPPMGLMGGQHGAGAKAAARLDALGGQVLATASPPMGFAVGGP